MSFKNFFNRLHKFEKKKLSTGIKKIIIRDNKDEYREIDVQELIDNDESLEGKLGY